MPLDGQSRAQGLKAATQNRAFTALKSLLSFGQETGYLAFNVGVALPLQPNHEGLAQRILAESDVARMIERTPEGRDQVILRLLYASGIRVSELAHLKWCDTMERSTRQTDGQGREGKTAGRSPCSAKAARRGRFFCGHEPGRC